MVPAASRIPRRLALLSASAIFTFGACSSSSPNEATPDESATNSVRTETDSAPDGTPASASMRAMRYCEVLLLNIGDAGLQAEVFNTYPLNECPDEVWAGLDGGEIAVAEAVPFAILNGPRFWLMDAVERLDDGSVIRKSFAGSAGEIEMNRYAVVTIGTPDTVGQAYAPQSVDRKSRFTFRSGSAIYLLTDPSGNRFVMQSWSQQRDPSLVEGDLASLGSRLDLPEGWTFSSETLTDDLVLDSTSAPARVFQDELMNSYSLIPG